MPIDGLSVYALREELSRRLANARTLKIYQPWPDTVIFHLRVGGTTERLLLSTAPAFPTAHLTKLQPENPLQAPLFAMVLRKHLEPARLLGVEQVGLDRILHFRFETFDEQGERTERLLVAELTGRVSNLILVDASSGRILEALHRHTAARRIIAPGYVYEPPFASTREPAAHQRQQDDLYRFLRLAPQPKKVAHLLLERLAGFGPLAAEEVLLRAQLDPAVTRGELTLEQLECVAHHAEHLITQVFSGAIRPTLFRTDAGLDAWLLPPAKAENRIVSSSSSLSEVLDAAFYERQRTMQLKQAQGELLKTLRRIHRRAERKLSERLKEQAEAQVADRLRHFADLLAANLYKIEPHSTEAVVPDYERDQAPVRIPLDPALSPVENVQAYYKKYQRAKRAARELERLIEEARMEAEYLAHAVTALELAEDADDVAEIARELQEAGFLPRKAGPGKKEKRPVRTEPLRFTSSEGHTILVGRNNRQNDHLTLRTARPHDLWFHTKQIPGSHVILRVDGPISDAVLEEAAILAAYYSKARESANVAVDYVERRHVRKPSGAPAGYVVYDNHRTIYVTPSPERIARLQRQNTQES